MEIIKLSGISIIICLYVILNHLRIPEALAVFATMICIVVIKMRRDMALENRGQQLITIIVGIFITICAIIPLINSSNFTYYGTTARGEYSSILDIATIVAGFLIASNQRYNHPILTVGLLAILYYWLPSRSIIIFCSGIIIFSDIPIRTKLFISALLLAFVITFLFFNEYFLAKTLNMLSGEEQRFAAIDCGIDVLRGFEIQNVLLGMGVDSLDKATASCLPEARLIEADVVDVILRMGLVMIPFYVLTIVKAWKVSPVFGVLFLYGAFFGHVFFNPLALIPMSFAFLCVPKSCSTNGYGR